MKTTTRTLLLGAALAAAALLGKARANDDSTVALCDGQSSLTIPGLKAGEELAPERARQVASEMVQVWRRNAGELRWASWTAEAAAVALAPAAPQAGAASEAAQPTKFTRRDQMLWQREEKKWVEEGYKAFHNAKALGGTIGISCDMCHPDASNTHPETYSKFQVQTKKVALLRDMINWCIENPMKGWLSRSASA